MGIDEWREVFVAGQSVPILYRQPAQAQARGAVLLVSSRSQGGTSAARSTQLRQGLTRLGFHTYLVGLPPINTPTATVETEDEQQSRDAQIAERVTAAAALMTNNHSAERSAGNEFTSLILSEGAAGRWVRAVANANVDGLVFIDTPSPKRRSDNWLLAPTLPVLMVQTAPYGWPPEQPLGATTELHLLPRQSLRATDSLLLRTVRGWTQRLSAAANKRS